MNADSEQKDPQTYAIIGAAMEVHRELGHGFLEAVYREALGVEFASRQIEFEREKLLQIAYKGGVLPAYYKADFSCFGECRALEGIGPVEHSQMVNYLQITGLTRAIILNFGAPAPGYKRIVPTRQKSAACA